MTKTHIPVLAGELIDLLDPRSGETAIDCTVGGGGHARLIAERIGPAGTLSGIDRDPVAEERFAALAAEVPCHTRFIRADFVTALTDLHEERLRADFVYLDLAAAEYLVEKGLVLFGLDDLSLGDIKQEEAIRKTHITLLGAGVYVLEGCALGHVPPGEYELLCLPLLMQGGDAGPARAILRPLR